jgi:hypothetical protein
MIAWKKWDGNAPSLSLCTCRIGNYFPRHLHSRDAAFPVFLNETAPDPNMLCGAVVAGPYAPGVFGGEEAVDGPVTDGTDVYTDNRDSWREAEPAVDYTGSLMCAVMGYAMQPDGAYSTCTARDPFAGRM